MAITIDYGPDNIPSNTPFEGPLETLFNNKYGYTGLKYPNDLESSYKGHVVKFDIFQNSTSVEDISSFISQNITALKETVNEVTNTPSVTEIKEKLLSGKLTSNYTGLNSNSSLKGSISLYMPETVEFTYSPSYQTISLADAAASLPIVGKIASAITSGLTSAAGALLLNKAGYVFNPQQQMLFQGIDFRTYNMTFLFSPKSPQEAQNVKDIIQLFKISAAPTVVEQAAGFFYIPPSTFNVSFLFNGRPNENLNKIEMSVIENIDVNYAPNGWAAHEDGAPIQTQLTIQFKELKLIDRKLMEKGY